MAGCSVGNGDTRPPALLGDRSCTWEPVPGAEGGTRGGGTVTRRGRPGRGARPAPEKGGDVDLDGTRPGCARAGCLMAVALARNWLRSIAPVPSRGHAQHRARSPSTPAELTLSGAARVGGWPGLGAAGRRLPRAPRVDFRGQRGPGLRRSAVLPEQRRIHLPLRPARAGGEGDLGRLARHRGGPPLHEGVDRGVRPGAEAERLAVDLRHPARDLLRRLRAPVAGLATAEHRHLVQAQREPEPLLPLLHPQLGDPDLGRAPPAGTAPAPLRLPPHEGRERRQADA